MGETRILPTHDKRNPLVLIPGPLLTVMGAQRDYRWWIWDQWGLQISVREFYS